MREIKFRGRDEHGEWHYGDLLRYVRDSYDMIVPVGHANSDDLYDDVVCVDYETVGQFTGLCDSEGKEIFEGDVLDCKPSPLYLRLYERLIAPVVYSDDGFVVDLKHAKISVWAVLHQDPKCRVVGNVYDNPELLEENNARD